MIYPPLEIRFMVVPISPMGADLRKIKNARCEKMKKGKKVQKKFNKYVHDKMWDWGGRIVTIVEMFHYLKDLKETYSILGLNQNKLEDRRLVREYNWLVPKIRIAYQSKPVNA